MFVFIDRYTTEIVADVNKVHMHMFLYLAYQCHVLMSGGINLLR